MPLTTAERDALIAKATAVRGRVDALVADPAPAPPPPPPPPPPSGGTITQLGTGTLMQAMDATFAGITPITGETEAQARTRIIGGQQQSQILDYCGAAVRGAGRYYSFPINGGHSTIGYDGFEEFDLQTNAWVYPPRVWPSRYGASVNSIANTFGEYNTSPVGFGRPADQHSDDHTVAVGDDIVQAFGYSITVNGSNGSKQAHRWRASTGAWSRYGSNSGGLPTNSVGHCFYEAVRNRIVRFPGDAAVGAIDTIPANLADGDVTTAWTTHNITTTAGTYERWPKGNLYKGIGYHPGLDCYVMVNPHLFAPRWRVYVLDAANLSQGWKLAAETTAPADADIMGRETWMHLEYVPPMNCFAIGAAGEPSKAFYLRPPVSGVITDQWVWSSEVFTGTASPWRQGSGISSRLRWSELRNGLVACKGPTAPMELWVPAALAPVAAPPPAPSPPPPAPPPPAPAPPPASPPPAAAADWATRSTLPEVEWAHNFTEQTEVDMFRANGYDWAVDAEENPTGGGAYVDINSNNKYCKWVAVDEHLGRPCMSLELPAGGPFLNVVSATSAKPCRITFDAPHGLDPAVFVSTVSFQRRQVYFKDFTQDGWAYKANATDRIIDTTSGQPGVNAYPTGGSWVPTFAAIYVNATTIDLQVKNGSAWADTTALAPYIGGAKGRAYIKSTSNWMRPFSPLPARYWNAAKGAWAGNGKSTPDPAANGTSPIKDSGEFVFTGPGPTGYRSGSVWRTGYFANPAYSEVCRTWPDKQTGGTAQTDGYMGHDFWIQFRVKHVAGRFDPANVASVGKLAWISVTGNTPTHELIIFNDAKLVNCMAGPRWLMYTDFGKALHPPQGYSSGVQYCPGSAWDHTSPNFDPAVTGDSTSTCWFNSQFPKVQNCWEFPENEWVTVLMHVIPGTHNPSSNPLTGGSRDFGIQVWAAKQSQLSLGYQKIYEFLGWSFKFGAEPYHPNAYNMFMPSTYMNERPVSGQRMEMRWADIIFAKGSGVAPAGGWANVAPLIPCPTV